MLAALSACSTVDVQPSPILAAGQRWVLLPILNYSETPLAGERAEALLDDLLRKKGLARLDRYPSEADADALAILEDRKRLEGALRWAREKHYGYAITGSVTEWRYRTGVDGEPVVGMVLQILDVNSGRVLWTATGSHTGWGRGNLTGSAVDLFNDLIAGLAVT